jgi:L-malate glycosyltransferase
MEKSFLESIREAFYNVSKHLTSKKLAVGILCRSSLGGSSIAAVTAAEELAKKGHSVHLITHGRPFRFNKNLPIKLHTISLKEEPIFKNFPETISIASKIVEIVEKEKLDILNIHYAIPYSVSAHLAREILLKKKIRTKMVTTLHGSDVHTYGKMKQFREVLKHVLDEQNGIVAVSDFISHQAFELGVKSTIRVIPNSIDHNRFCPRQEESLRKFKEKFAPNKEKIIIHASNFRKVKRTEDIVRAFNLIISKKIKAKLVLLGNGPEKNKTSNLVKRLKLGKHVFFEGSIKRIERYYSIADLFMMASEKEGMPLSILEAMSSEVPVVSTDVGGISEIMANGETGFLVEKGDIRELANKSIEILSNKSLSEKMGKTAREKILNSFTREKMAKSYERYYREILLLQ